MHQHNTADPEYLESCDETFKSANTALIAQIRAVSEEIQSKPVLCTAITMKLLLNGIASVANQIYNITHKSVATVLFDFSWGYNKL